MSSSSRQRSILFLSGSDFKEKSIQVIRKTPEAYVSDGWRVVYVVGRDNSKSGDYFYEGEINPSGVEVIRFYVPLAKMHDLIDHVVWKAIWFRVRNILLVLSLAINGMRQLRDNAFDVLYGYEVPGVLASRIVRSFSFVRQLKFVTRFQGVLYVKEWLRRGQKFRRLSNFEAFMALKTSSDLCIMTNDGSQGLEVLKKIDAKHKKILFYSNGVDPIELDDAQLSVVKDQFYNQPDTIYFISVSRLDGHKRIDRGIKVIAALVRNGLTNIRYIVVGAGAEQQRLESLIDEKDVRNHVTLIGAVPHHQVKYHYQCADIFLSMYTSTNVGNPLLEAIRFNKIIVTLNNGDTGDWIQHMHNGLLYDVDDVKDLSEEDYGKIAKDIADILRNRSKWNELKKQLQITEQKRLWTWQDRFKAEVSAVNDLLA